MPFTRTVIETAAVASDRLAIVGDRESITYGELLRSSARVRGAVETLAPVGATAPPPVVALALTRAFDSARLLASLGTFRAVAAVLDPLWPEEHRVETVRRVQPAVVVTDDPAFEKRLAALPGWSGAVVSLSSFDALGEATPSMVGADVRPPAEDFLLLFTSGTTDLPKGFLRTRGSWQINVGVSRRYLGASTGASTIAPGPISYSLTLYALVEVMATAGSLHVQSRFDAVAATSAIAEHRIERFVGVPSMLLALPVAARRAGAGSRSLASLRDVITGGANLPEHIRRDFQEACPDARLRSYYGASEIGFIGYSDGGDGTLLTPFDGVEVSIRDEAGAELPVGELGTLHIRVASSVERYLAATSAQLITDQHGWASVDDRAQLQGERILLAGRAGDTAVIGGHKVSLVQVERALASLPGCEHCCAVGVPDAQLGSLLAVAIEGPPSSIPSKPELLSHLRERLAPQFMPRRFVRVDELPRTAGGKVRRAAVQGLVAAGGGDRL